LTRLLDVLGGAGKMPLAFERSELDAMGMPWDSVGMPYAVEGMPSKGCRAPRGMPRLSRCRVCHAPCSVS
jgi:hypothetical protein